jgi:hypothetical protein
MNHGGIVYARYRRAIRDKYARHRHATDMKRSPVRNGFASTTWELAGPDCGQGNGPRYRIRQPSMRTTQGHGQGRESRAPDRIKTRVKVFRGVKVFHENAEK